MYAANRVGRKERSTSKWQGHERGITGARKDEHETAAEDLIHCTKDWGTVRFGASVLELGWGGATWVRHMVGEYGSWSGDQKNHPLRVDNG